MSIRVGSDFSGVGAFDYALKELNINYKTVFACDMDKFARQSFIAAHGEPEYYPVNVYDREVPKESLDIYMTSPPCQSFSIAGKRGGKNDKRGILFFNSHEFIKKNKPRYFIFENVKGLLSDDNGNTFNEWVNMLGGKSVNGLPILFSYEDSVPYHIYWKVINAKKHGVPQNRERIFIIGIRDDEDNSFTWPKEMPLTRKLKDILEPVVDEKYFLSDKMVNSLLSKNDQDNGFTFKPKTEIDLGNCITARCFKMGADDNYIKIKSATKSGYEFATENDSINFSVPNSKTRRGRVGKEVAQTSDTQCSQGVIQLNNPKHSNDRVYSQDGCSPTLNTMQGGNRQPFVVCFGRSETEKKRRKEEFQRTGKDSGSFKDKNLIMKNQDHYDTLLASPNPQKEGLLFDGYRIRRLTPLECFRLMAFPDSHVHKCKQAGVSNSQLYKQAGNSIVVDVLAQILDKLKL